MRQDTYQKVKIAYQLFKHHIGDEITTDEIVARTGWKIASVRTYYSKKWVGYILEKIDTNTYHVCMPEDLAEVDFVEHHSQIDDQVKHE